jgi:membrane AbrB-like protein
MLFPGRNDPGKLEIIAFPAPQSQNRAVDNAIRSLRVAGALTACLAGGLLCAWLATPLPWMIGPLLTMALLQLSGARLEAPPYGRAAGQVVVGITLGLYFTPPVVREVAAFGPWFVLLGFLVTGAGALCAVVIGRVARVDRATAWFSSMPGAAADMAVLGEKHGALADRVALANSMRMMFVVTVVPVGITFAGFSGAEDYRPVGIAFHGGGLAGLVALGVVLALAAQRLRVPNAFMIAPLLGTIAITVAGVSLSSVPTVMTNAAQLLLACSLGATFQRSFLREAPRFVAALIPAGALMLVLCAMIGVVLSWGSGVYLGATLLSAAPGGIAEMSITAKVLKIGVPFVTAAHVIRYLIVILFAQPLFRLYQRTG